MGTIPLTQGLVALVDDEDVEFLSQWKWCACKTKYTAYAVRNVGQKGKAKTLYMHRFLLVAPKGTEVDHKDQDGLDNTRANLRLCTHSGNQRNRKKNLNSLSQYKGVSWWEKSRKWKAYISIDGIRRHLGFFENEEDAARAYNKAASLLFGEFARLNQIMGGNAW